LITGAWTNTILLRHAALLPAPPGVEGEVIIQKVLGKPFTVGYNAMADRVTDLLEEGVIDPAKVTRNGLMNACSIAGIMLTTQAVMVEKQRPEGAPGGMSGGMPAGMAV
jgi:chaperonin GroEL (HSP60 family)